MNLVSEENDMITEFAVKSAYDQVRQTTERLWNATERELAAKTMLEKTKAQMLADGTIQGKNAELREASARDILHSQYTALELAEETVRKARLDFDLARIDLEEMRTLLRLAEVTVGVSV